MNYQIDAGMKPRRKEKQRVVQPPNFKGDAPEPGTPFQRADGSIGVDKTLGFKKSRAKRDEIRRANRAGNKRARQRLALVTKQEAEEL